MEREKMTLQELQDKINAGEITVYKGLQEMFGISDDTIRRRFEELGLKWEYRTKNLTGKLSEEHAKLEAKAFFEKKDNPIKSNAKAPKSKPKSTSKQKHAKEHLEMNATARAEVSATVEALESTDMQLDIFDMLLQAKAPKKPTRVSRSFYIDSDILPILDNVKGGNKSDLVNEALRRVFREKGLL